MSAPIVAVDSVGAALARYRERSQSGWEWGWQWARERLLDDARALARTGVPVPLLAARLGLTPLEVAHLGGVR